MSTLGPVMIGPTIAPPSRSGADPPDGRGSAFPALLAASQAQAGENVRGSGIPPDSESTEASGATLDHHVEAPPKTGTETITTDPLLGTEPEGEAVAVIADPDANDEAADAPDGDADGGASVGTTTAVADDGAEPAPTSAGNDVDGDVDSAVDGDSGAVDDGAPVDDGPVDGGDEAGADGRNPQAASGTPVAYGRDAKPGTIDGPPAFGREAIPPGLAKRPTVDGSVVAPDDGAVVAPGDGSVVAPDDGAAGGTPPAYGRDVAPGTIDGPPALGREAIAPGLAKQPAGDDSVVTPASGVVAEPGVDAATAPGIGAAAAGATIGSDANAAAAGIDAPTPAANAAVVDVPAVAEQGDVPAAAAQQAAALGRTLDRGSIDGPPALGLRSVSARADGLPPANVLTSTSGEAGNHTSAPSGEAAVGAEIEGPTLPASARATAQAAVAARGSGGEPAAVPAEPQASPVATAVAAPASVVANATAGSRR